MTESVNTPVDQDEDDFYDEATTAFVSVDDLVPPKGAEPGPGRLVAIWALENGTAKGDNGVYPYTETITLVLDDGLNGDLFTDLAPSTSDGNPVRLDLRHSTTMVHAQLRSRVEGRNSKGIRLKYRPAIGRLNTRASTKYKKGSAAVSLGEPTAADMEIVQRHKALIISINKEIQAKDTKSEDDQAFD